MIILYIEFFRLLHCWLSILVVSVVRKVSRLPRSFLTPVVLGQKTGQDVGGVIVFKMLNILNKIIF